MCIVSAPVAAVIVSVIGTVVSTALTVSQAKAAAAAQGEANQRAAEQAAAKATAKNLAANTALRQQASIEVRQRLDASKAHESQVGKNVVSAAEQGTYGNYLLDVSQAVNLSGAEEQSAITVQSLFAKQKARLSAASTSQSLLNEVDNLPTYDAGLQIGGVVAGGLTEIGTGVLNSGLFGEGGDGGETFTYADPSTIGTLETPNMTDSFYSSRP